jgi:AcrR family transcriptional regulator
VKASALRPRKQPRQARAADMVELILEAATRVLGKESLDGFNTNRVAEVAGISIGSLYQYFPNKSALVATLIERAQARLSEALEQAMAAHRGESLETTLAALVDIAIAQQYGNAIYAAALDHEERRLPLGTMLGASQARMVSTVQALLKEHQERLGGHCSLVVALDCLTITKALVESETNQRSVDLAALKVRILRALCGYLCYDVAQSRSSRGIKGRRR